MTTEQILPSREAFEHWWQQTTGCKSAPTRFKNSYLHRNPGLAWLAWQACASHMQDENKRLREEIEYCTTEGNRLIDEIAAEIPQWKPIGSAPKQRGKSLLVYCYGDRCVYTACWWNEEWTHFHGSEPIIGLITHWMPLPAPPKGGDFKQSDLVRVLS